MTTIWLYLNYAMPRQKHPNKAIEAALRYAEENGWTIEKSGRGHCWGQMLCPKNSTACRNGIHCRQSIWSTPRVPENHARDLVKVVDKCQFLGDEDG